MRRGKVELSPEIVVRIMRKIYPGLPEDIRFVGGESDRMRQTLSLCFESDEFKDVAEAGEPPTILAGYWE